MMPVYEFKCKECGEVSEFLVRSSLDSRMSVCSNCGSRNLERLISAPRLLKERANAPGTTCCGRTERCETPPCSTGERCRKH